ELKRGLSNRHIQLIALGGAIGTGLFLGVGQAAILAGPSVIVGYAIAGLVAFFIMRQLDEMVVEEPISGSFSSFANKYWGPFAGFFIWMELLDLIYFSKHGGITRYWEIC